MSAARLHFFVSAELLLLTRAAALTKRKEIGKSEMRFEMEVRFQNVA